MAVKLLCLCLLLAEFCPTWALEQKCLNSASSCKECLQSGPECAWCTDPQTNVHCDTLESLLKSGCLYRDIYNPQGQVEIVKNDSRQEAEKATAFFLQPQELSINLRPGVSQSFPITITMPTGQPVTELNIDTSPVPEGVNITFSSAISTDVLLLQVSVEAAKCPTESDDITRKQNQTGPWSVHITPRGFSHGVKLEITLECQCDCINIHEENSPSCGGRGTLTCGQCKCNMPYIGQQCQVDISVPTNEDLCRSSPNAPVCSGRGYCVGEGVCECKTPVDPAERYSGRYCECSNFNCPRMNNRLCGGHGKCECGHCICDPDWTGEDCSCTMSTASCMAKSEKVCNDRGYCRCGVCACESPYFGPTCEVCPTCGTSCSWYVDCVECLTFKTGPKKDTCEQDCGHLPFRKTLNLSTEYEEGKRFCRMRNEDGCVYSYTLMSVPSGGHTIEVWDNGVC